MRQSVRAAIWAFISALTILVVGAVLPFWTVWHFSSWEGLGRPGPLWEALGQVQATRRAAANGSDFWHLQWDNLVKGVSLLTLAGFVFWGVYRVGIRRGRSDEACDFADGPSGSLTDGRAPLSGYH